MAITHSLARNETTNAVIGWGLLVLVSLVGAANVFGTALLWGIFAWIAAVILMLPAVLTRDWRVMVPWPLVLFVAIPIVVRSLGFFPEIAGYLAVSGLALAVVVQIDAFTDVEMSRRLAILFAVMTTMAFQTWWTIGQYYSDLWLGTMFIRSQVELQWDLVAVTVVGLVMGGFFFWYFDRIEHVGSRERPVVPKES
jgi:hypothetical protein